MNHRGIRDADDAKRLQEFLEETFGKDRLVELDNDDPLYQLYDFARDFKNQFHIYFDGSNVHDKACKIYRTFLNFATMSSCWETNTNSKNGLDPIQFGGIDGKEEFTRRLLNQDSFWHTMLEMWASYSLATTDFSLQSKGFKVRPIRPDISKRPDLVVLDENDNECAFVECKNSYSWKPRSIKNCVKEKHAQLRELCDKKSVPGLLVIGLLGGPVLSDGHSKSRIRAYLSDAVTVIQRKLDSGEYPYIANVYLVWDELIISNDIRISVNQMTFVRAVAVITNSKSLMALPPNMPQVKSHRVSLQIRRDRKGGSRKPLFLGDNDTPDFAAADASRKATRAIEMMKEYSGFRVSPETEILFGFNSREVDGIEHLDIAVFVYTLHKRVHFIWHATIDISGVEERVYYNAETAFYFVCRNFGKEFIYVDRKCRSILRLDSPFWLHGGQLDESVDSDIIMKCNINGSVSAVTGWPISKKNAHKDTRLYMISAHVFAVFDKELWVSGPFKKLGYGLDADTE